MKELVKNISQPEPYVLMFGDQFFLVIDCIVVTEVDAETVQLLCYHLTLYSTLDIQKAAAISFHSWRCCCWEVMVSQTVKTFFSFIVN